MKKLELLDSWPLRHECVSNLSGRALDCKSCSAQVVYSGTQDISLAVDFATLVMDKAQFLLECSTMIAPAMWVGVKPGSIVLTVGGATQAILDAAVITMTSQGPNLPSFGSIQKIPTVGHTCNCPRRQLRLHRRVQKVPTGVQVPIYCRPGRQLQLHYLDSRG